MMKVKDEEIMKRSIGTFETNGLTIAYSRAGEGEPIHITSYSKRKSLNKFNTCNVREVSQTALY
ncbi:hypothetical protein CHCC14821_0837 [Bacillus paralicheniformis]|nr:hypothetical protein CHCC14821_0837 [Bacillus paralicheniformis]